ncbi:MAG TPA: phenylalanine--tRNA ligase subunit beta [Ktedonobacterales bacterium]
MRVPLRWLREYVEVEMSPEELANRLTMAGLEVDAVEHLGQHWDKIVTAHVLWAERIKGSDHLSATRVNDGTHEWSVVCGAPNVAAGQKVALAQVGAKIGDLVIQPKKAMGVMSEGMICSPRELGLNDEHNGIYVLPPETPVGVPLSEVLGETIIDLDIKAHRGDLYCMIGIAREVAAFSGKQLHTPEVKVTEQGRPASELMSLVVEDSDLCPRYTARVITGVKIGPSPHWLAERLTHMGLRSINNVVDITNYVMLEYGQPLHAFDYDKVAEHRIVVRRARAGETIKTLDDVQRKLTTDMLLITDPNGPTGIAGVMGGSTSEVSDATTNILLEAAHFKATNIRRTAVALGMRTDASSRFEKGVDPELTGVAADRAAQLMVELAGGTVAPGRVDFYPEPVKRRRLPFTPDEVEWLTALRVTQDEIVQTLRALGFGVEPEEHSERVLVTVPTWRGDVEESADLVEEVAREIGYDKIQSTIPQGELPEPLHGSWFEREEFVRDVLVGRGMVETVTYPLTSRATMAKLFSPQLLAAGSAGALLLGGPDSVALQASGEAGQNRAVAIAPEQIPAIVLANSLSSELEAMRLTLMGSLLTVLRENAKHESAGMRFFELGRRYLPTAELKEGTGLAEERRTLGMVLSGPAEVSWAELPRDADFYDLKGVVESLLASLKIGSYRFTAIQHPTFHPGRCALLEVAVSTDAPAGALAETGAGAWQRVGILGEVHPQVQEAFDLPRRASLTELDLERLYAGVPGRIAYQGFSRYPAVTRDLAIVVGQDVPAQAVQSVIWATGGALVRSVALFDVYTGEPIPAGKKSLAYTVVYQSDERTLTDQEVDALQGRIVAEVAQQLGGTLRG